MEILALCHNFHMSSHQAKKLLDLSITFCRLLWFSLLGLHEAETRAARYLKQELHLLPCDFKIRENQYLMIVVPCFLPFIIHVSCDSISIFYRYKDAQLV